MRKCPRYPLYLHNMQKFINFYRSLYIVKCSTLSWFWTYLSAPFKYILEMGNKNCILQWGFGIHGAPCFWILHKYKYPVINWICEEVLNNLLDAKTWSTFWTPPESWGGQAQPFCASEYIWIQPDDPSNQVREILETFQVQGWDLCWVKPTGAETMNQENHCIFQI